MNYTDNQVAYCAMNKIFGYHPCIAIRLLGKAVLPTDLFNGTHTVPLPTEGPDDVPHPELFEQLTPASLEWARKELARLDSLGYRFICLEDDDYPEPLRECEDPPLGIYLHASSSPAEIFSLRPMIAFVGTRDISPYGKLWCQKMVQALADAPIQPTIVSGLALGADGIAHQAAMDHGLPTIGVMATGIDSIYPWLHEKLAREMVKRPGCALVTDYPMGTAPVALNFLRRNRIIAGLVSSVVVVESKSQGGSLMTARYACEYSRNVYVLPGRIDDIRSAGCNSLISNNMAEIITSPEDLVGKLGLGRIHRGSGGSWATYREGDTPQEILRARLVKKFGPSSTLIGIGMAIQENLGVGAEELARTLKRPLPTILADLGILQAHGIITTDLLGRSSLSPSWT